MKDSTASLKLQVAALEAAIECKEQEIKEYQETINLLLATIEKEADREQSPCDRLPVGAFTA